MAVKKKLGANPLTQGIFTKTSTPEEIQEPRKKNQDSLAEAAFLDQGIKEKINLRIPADLNDWLDGLLKAGKRRHGKKIPKEIWVQAALEFLRVMPVDWNAITGEAELRSTLLNLSSRIPNQE